MTTAFIIGAILFFLMLGLLTLNSDFGKHGLQFPAGYRKAKRLFLIRNLGLGTYSRSAWKTKARLILHNVRALRRDLHPIDYDYYMSFNAYAKQLNRRENRR